MTEHPGSAERPLRVAIVGAGPSGFYAAAALLKERGRTTIDLFDRLIAQGGSRIGLPICVRPCPTCRGFAPWSAKRTAIAI